MHDLNQREFFMEQNSKMYMEKQNAKSRDDFKEEQEQDT